MYLVRPLSLTILFLLFTVDPPNSIAEVIEVKGGFRITRSLRLPETPEGVYDAMTGEISQWWDHSHSGNPKSIYVEARPGGHFYEVFDDEGNGAIHATVIYADRGKLLRWDGPMGLSGLAVQMVTSFAFQETKAGTTELQMTTNVSGQLDPEDAKMIDQVWKHFLEERLKPYIESEEYKNK